MGPSLPIIGSQMMIVGLFLSKGRFMVLVMFTWVELKVPIPGLFLQRPTFPGLLIQKVGLIGAIVAAQSKKTSTVSNV